jgi:hypothetical protein
MTRRVQLWLEWYLKGAGSFVRQDLARQEAAVQKLLQVHQTLSLVKLAERKNALVESLTKLDLLFPFRSPIDVK